MILNQAIKIAKGDDEEKVGMSVKMPVSLKEDLQQLANGNNVSLNALICSILDVAINEKGATSGSITGQAIVSQITSLNKRKSSILDFVEENCGLDPEVESEKLLMVELSSIDSTIELLKELVS